ncbi:MAG TPA: glycosyltransferase family 4 protein [Lacipirellula sp.]
MARRRVLFINRSYWPDVEATGQLLTELCESLAHEFEVHVLCGQPRRVLDVETYVRRGADSRNGVTIHRVRHTQFNKASFFGRIVNMITFQASAAWQALRAPRPDIVVTETDPPFLCLLGWLLQSLRRCQHIAYLQDIYPDVAVALGKLKTSWHSDLLRRLFLAAYRRSRGVIVLSRDMRELLIDSGLPGSLISVIPNWADTQAIYPAKSNNHFRRRHGLQRDFVVMYSGNMGLSQRLDEVLEAAELLIDRDNIMFVLVGDGAERSRLEQLAAHRHLRNVRFFDYQAKADLADSLSAADVHLIILRPEIKRLLMPSKLYGILASDTPAIVWADPDCELAHVVASNDLGTVASASRATDLAEVIRQAADSPDVVARQGRAARAYALKHCGRDRSVYLIRTLLGGPPPSGKRDVVDRGRQAEVLAGAEAETSIQRPSPGRLSETPCQTIC